MVSFRGRAFLYQDGDANITLPMGKRMSAMEDTYRIALEEANKLHQQLKAERSMTKEPKGLKPPSYVKLKVRFIPYFIYTIFFTFSSNNLLSI